MIRMFIRTNCDCHKPKQLISKKVIRYPLPYPPPWWTNELFTDNPSNNKPTTVPQYHVDDTNTHSIPSIPIENDLI